MAIGKIEPTGLGVRNGKVQLRFSFYLELNDPRYEEHYVQVSVIPEGGYLGKVNAEGDPIDMNNYDKWLEDLPKVWQNNPFHNHFEYVDAMTTDEEIRRLLTIRLIKFFSIWKHGGDILGVWTPKYLVTGDISIQNINSCEVRVADIIKRIEEFSVTLRER